MEVESIFDPRNVFRRFITNVARFTLPFDDEMRENQFFNPEPDEKKLEEMQQLQQKKIPLLLLPLQYAEWRMTLDKNA